MSCAHAAPIFFSFNFLNKKMWLLGHIMAFFQLKYSFQGRHTSKMIMAAYNDQIIHDFFFLAQAATSFFFEAAATRERTSRQSGGSSVACGRVSEGRAVLRGRMSGQAGSSGGT
jgi:hypothetical protein